MQSTAPVIDLNIPFGLPGHEYAEGKPLFTAYGCVLYEKETPKGYSYRAQNLESSHTVRIGYRKEPMGETQSEKTAEKIRALPIARRGYYEADRSSGGTLPRPGAGSLSGASRQANRAQPALPGVARGGMLAWGRSFFTLSVCMESRPFNVVTQDIPPRICWGVANRITGQQHRPAGRGDALFCAAP